MTFDRSTPYVQTLAGSVAGKPVHIPTTKSTVHQAMKGEWETSREKAKHGRDLFRLGARPGKAILDTHMGTRKVISAAVTQMRTGKISLRAYLHAIKKADTDKCQCGRNRRPCDTTFWNAGTGQKDDTECGQANLHAWALNAFSIARQWRYKQQR
ncbi:hypothetical protein AJ78_04071 [Emergomyces pasteurianus Ep9510]|uniref:Uncharacterized protein n=1 Tax=Emergomyces pasteurianus Ep9510 TaxID=1447872 RepID=A0A1J9QHS5_9EURO|nr:hypothetical protein AJ78_04071 [Emergomyces pasteurianus Ep9510]